jgi:hypothetical protein
MNQFQPDAQQKYPSGKPLGYFMYTFINEQANTLTYILFTIE